MPYKNSTITKEHGHSIADVLKELHQGYLWKQRLPLNLKTHFVLL